MTGDIISAKALPHKFLYSIAAEDIMLMNEKGIKHKIEAEIGPYLRQVYGDNIHPDLHSFLCPLPDELQKRCVFQEGILQTKILR